MQSPQSSQSWQRSPESPNLKALPHPSERSFHPKPRQLGYYERFSGIIRGEWHRQNGQLQSICYGTAIALSKRVILTCAHSVYLQKKRKVCDSVSFIPNHYKGRLTRREKIYTSAKQNFIKLELIKRDQTFSKMPIPQDLALVYLSEDMDFDFFPDVGVDSQSELQIGSDILISGFPSMNYFTRSNLKEISFERTTLQGTLLQITENTLYHNLQTSTGHSGSGIVGRRSKTGQVTILGVHTHKGKRRNSAVYLSAFLLRRLAKYELQFGLEHGEYDMSINFPERIKEQVFKELSREERLNLTTRNKFYEKICRRVEEQQLYDEYDNSEMVCSVDDEDDFEEGNEDKELALLIKQQQEKVLKTQKTDQELIEKHQQNKKMREHLLSQYSTMTKQSQQLFYRSNQIQSTFLQIFTKLQQAPITPLKSTNIQMDLISFCQMIQSQLLQTKQRVRSMEQIQVIHVKIASVTEHMAHTLEEQIMNDYEQELYRDFEILNADIIPVLRSKIIQSYHSEYKQEGQTKEKVENIEFEQGVQSQLINIIS